MIFWPLVFALKVFQNRFDMNEIATPQVKKAVLRDGRWIDVVYVLTSWLRQEVKSVLKNPTLGGMSPQNVPSYDFANPCKAPQPTTAHRPVSDSNFTPLAGSRWIDAHGYLCTQPLQWLPCFSTHVLYWLDTATWSKKESRHQCSLS